MTNREIVADMWERSKREIAEAAASFPAEFGLRAFAGDTFRISLRSSYVSQGKVMLYTERKTADGWQSFAKGTRAELMAEIVCQHKFRIDSENGTARCIDCKIVVSGDEL